MPELRQELEKRGRCSSMSRSGVREINFVLRFSSCCARSETVIAICVAPCFDDTRRASEGILLSATARQFLRSKCQLH